MSVDGLLLVDFLVVAAVLVLVMLLEWWRDRVRARRGDDMTDDRRI